MISQEDLDDIRQEMLQECKEEECKERNMRIDYDYFSEEVINNSGVVEALNSVRSYLNDYGYEITVKEFLEDIGEI